MTSLHRRPLHLAVLCLVAGLLLPMLTGCATIRDRRILIMDFENTVPGGNEASKYSVALAEMMTSCLANSPRVAVLDRQDLGTLLARTSGPHALRWQDIGRKAQADYVLVGSIARLDQNFIITARLLSVRTGEIVKGSSITRYARREEDIYPAVQAICHVLSYQLKYLAELYDAKARGIKVTTAVNMQQPAPASAPSAPAAEGQAAGGAPSVPEAPLAGGAPDVQITH